jgi:cell division protein ZapA (FtsZ GTPase activity inhibitor)
MGMYEKGVVTVQIFGKEYPIASDQNREYVEKLADYVDRRMSEIAAGGETFASGKIAVQACLDIADDLMRTRSEKEQLITTVQETISGIAKMIEHRLEQRQVCSGIKRSQET